MTTWNELTRADESFWRNVPLTATSSRPLTADDLHRGFDAAVSMPSRFSWPLLISMSMLEYAGRALGWPLLDEYFERLARGAAHSLFGNISVNVRQLVSAEDAGRYWLGGAWPFPVTAWSAPQHWFGPEDEDIYE